MAAAAIRERLPAVYGFRQFVEAGGLMPTGPSLPGVYQRSAALVDKILNGAKPADLPIEIPTRYELVLNQQAAKAIGLTFPPILLPAPMRSSNEGWPARGGSLSSADRSKR